MAPEDIPAVVSLAADEPTAPHWPVFEYQRMLQVIALASDRRGAWVLVDDETPVGFAMASHVAGICDLEAVVVASAWRGRRFGQLLAEAVITWARDLGARRVELEVRASNAPAVRLYARLGFSQDGVRPGYYQNPHEDALLMSRAL